MTGMKDELLVKADGILRQLTGRITSELYPATTYPTFPLCLKTAPGRKPAKFSAAAPGAGISGSPAGPDLEMQPALPVIIDDSL